MLRFVVQHETSLTAKTGAGTKPITLAVGSDHGGFELKEALKHHLKTKGVSFTDFEQCVSEVFTDGRSRGCGFDRLLK